MRKVLCSLLALGTFIVVCAQGNGYIKPATLTVNFSGIDFKTPASLRGRPVLPAYSNFSLKNVWAGLGISYLKGVGTKIDFVGSVNGTFLYYPFRNERGNINRTRHLLLAADAALNIKMLSDKHPLVPYITAGVGAFSYDTASGGYIPLGIGLQYNVKNKVYILLNAQYRLPIGTLANNNLFYSLGVGIPLKKVGNRQTKKTLPDVPDVPVVKPVVEEKPVVVADVDTDGDGIVDRLDKCPTVAGLAQYQGCPIPDTDGDGVIDDEDRCPTIPGLARYKGCPIPDSDGDGINDEIDRCPTVAGPASNGGCPTKATANTTTNTVTTLSTADITKQIGIAAKEIYFETAKAILLPKSFSKLNTVVALMKENEALKIEVDGHTDNVGTIVHNQTLSENRAAAVVAYIVSKGIAPNRLMSKGFGGSVPIVTNATPAGRAKNRRVEIKINE